MRIVIPVSGETHCSSNIRNQCAILEITYIYLRLEALSHRNPAAFLTHRIVVPTFADLVVTAQTTDYGVLGTDYRSGRWAIDF